MKSTSPDHPIAKVERRWSEKLRQQVQDWRNERADLSQLVYSSFEPRRIPVTIKRRRRNRPG